MGKELMGCYLWLIWCKGEGEVNDHQGFGDGWLSPRSINNAMNSKVWIVCTEKCKHWTVGKFNILLFTSIKPP